MARRKTRNKTRDASPPPNGPVRPGMSSGLLRVLPEGAEARIHQAALQVLEEIGMAQAPPSAVEMITAAGGWMTDAGRLCFPPGLVEDTVAKANRNFTICGQDPKHDIEPQGSRTYFGTGGGTITKVDPITRQYSKPTVQDLYDYARLVDTLDNIHFYQRGATPQDIDSVDDLDINIPYTCLRGTSKPIGTSWYHAHNVERCLEMFHLVAGGEKRWRERPFVIHMCAFTIPPLRFAHDACLAMEAAVRGGMPVQVASVPQAGATAPVTLAGTLVQSVSECLAGLVYANLVDPAAKVIIGQWDVVSDLRTGSMNAGGAETSLLMAGACQMARFYDLPSACASGLTDSKLPDAQYGYEKGSQNTFVANAGGNLIYAAAGPLASVTACSKAGLVIDNDIIGLALRTLTGIKVDEVEMAMDVLRTVNLDGPGHYLGHPLTYERMKRDFRYPTVADRQSTDDWLDSGSQSAVERATKMAEEILANHYPTHLPDTVDNEIRKRFPIALPLSATKPPPVAKTQSGQPARSAIQP